MRTLQTYCFVLMMLTALSSTFIFGQTDIDCIQPVGEEIIPVHGNPSQPPHGKVEIVDSCIYWWVTQYLPFEDFNLKNEEGLELLTISVQLVTEINKVAVIIDTVHGLHFELDAIQDAELCVVDDNKIFEITRKGIYATVHNKKRRVLSFLFFKKHP